MSSLPARILIVDDHPAVREALTIRLAREPDLAVCGEAPDAATGLDLYSAERPDAAVIDISLKGGDGLDLIRRIKARDPAARLLVWSMHAESLCAERALRAGAAGYINKEQATDQIVAALRRVLSGRVYLSETITERLLSRAAAGHEGAATSPVEALSDRELEVFRLIGRGAKTAEIAASLHLSGKTVETYRDRIRAKLGLATGPELARAAFLQAQGDG